MRLQEGGRLKKTGILSLSLSCRLEAIATKLPIYIYNCCTHGDVSKNKGWKMDL